MNNNYKIVRTIFENVFQRVLECKENDTGDIFYSNIITSQKVINLINLDELKRIPSNILECYNTDDRIYIYTKPLKIEYRGLRELASDSLTLKHQFNLSQNVINLAQNIFNMTDVVQQKILDLDKLYVDEKNEIIVDCNLIFEQEYDIADNETFKRLGNMIHFIFSGTEIIDYNISDSIPPDILKIIVRCLTREYIFPNDVLTELKNSPIYAMIFGIDNFNNKVLQNENDLKIHKEYKEHIKKNEYEQPEDSKVIYDEAAADVYTTNDNTPVLDIYVNDNNPIKTISNLKNLFSKKDISRAAVSILIVAIVLLAGNKLIKVFSDSEPSNSDNVQKENENPIKTPPEKENPENAEGESVTPDPEITDSTEKYFNEQLFSSVNYTGNKATIDSDIYVEGKNSLIVANEVDEKAKALFAIVDFKDEKFNYMLKKQISIATKMKAETDVKAQIVLEAFKDGKLTSNFHSKADIYNDIWSQFVIPINVTDADSLNIYIEFEGKNKVWIDDISIDVSK